MPMIEKMNALIHPKEKGKKVMSVDRKLAFLTLYLKTGTPSWEAYAARASSLPLLSSGMVNTPTIS